MKNLLLISIFLYSLQFTSCTTTSQALATPQYPLNAELHHGNYGSSLYSASTAHTQAMVKMYYTYCDTARMDGRRQIAPVTAPIASNVVALNQ